MLSSDHGETIITYADKLTLATVRVDNVVGTGISRCNPTDHYNKEIGEHIAVARALKSIVESYEQLWMNRAKTKDEVVAQRAAKKKA